MLDTLPMLSAKSVNLGVLLATLVATPAQAYILPYTVRTQGFSSWTPSARGDTNTIGMAGATVGLPTSISAAEANPAGFAMTTGSVSAQINRMSLSDHTLQRSGDPIESSQWGLGVSPEHWGFSITFYSPETESGTYVSPNSGDTVKTEVSLQELRFTLARTFFSDTVSIGTTFEIAKAVRALDDASMNNYAASFQLGALYRLPYHLLIGFSYAPEVSVGPAANPDPQTVMPGFNQAVVRPRLVTLGWGWIPNRFFKAGISLTAVGRTENTALLYDQTIATGASATWVPRFGLSYVIAEYSNLKVEGAAGSYFEASRLSNQSDRVHVTVGVEVNPYFVNLGAGFDVSNGYRNYLVSSGIDIVRTARAFNIIPKETVPAYRGILPPINHISPDGLPSGLTADEPKNFETSGVGQVGKIVSEVPGNIEKKISGEKTTVEVREIGKKAAGKERAERKAARRKIEERLADTLPSTAAPIPASKPSPNPVAYPVPSLPSRL